MLIVAPDFDRRIDLPGAGPCPRPVDIDRARSGHADLVSLRIYSFAEGMVIDGEAEADEVFIVLMRGQATIAVSVNGQRVASNALDETGGARAIYLPPHAAYQLTATTNCDIAYARARPAVDAFPATQAFTSNDGQLSVRDHAIGMTLALARLDARETFALDGPGDDLPERFVHVRSDTGFARIDSQRLADWHSATLDAGEPASLNVGETPIDFLLIAAKSP